MRINDRNQLGTGAAQGTAGADGIDGRSPTHAGKGRTAEQDRTELSPLAQPLAETITGQSPERVARIEELKAAVAVGQYHADSSAVSRALVDDVLAGGVEE